ncbi:RNA polymerase sigma factor [Sphingomonas tabacisoli]|uniref:RNA polymerase sigma factor n=1 Tax=Sphingomonas tabacisoli TaxID=2249466 RepID=A0ABW4I468_9SPHN
MAGSGFESEMIALLPRLRRFAHALARSSADADDLCQAAVERALKSRAQWQPGTRLDSWMYRIMRNLWIDETRARGRRDQTFAPEEAGVNVGDDGARRADIQLQLTDLDRALNKLAEEQREVIALVLVEGLAYKEAAEVLGVPIGTLTSRLSRAREALIAQLGDAA